MKFELGLDDLKKLFSGNAGDDDTKQVGYEDNHGKFCVIRTYSAGVHCGVLKECSNDMTVVRLITARRIWNWNGANTLHEVSKNGVSEKSRISEVIDSITISGVIEIIPCTEKAEENLRTGKWS